MMFHKLLLVNLNYIRLVVLAHAALALEKYHESTRLKMNISCTTFFHVANTSHPPPA